MTELQPNLPSLFVFDQSVTLNSPAGSCVLAEVLGLALDFDITVFSSKLDSPHESKIKFVQIPLPKKPLILRYIVFQILAPLASAYQRLSNCHAGIALSQGTQGQYVGAEIVYAHFCHRAYLNSSWKDSPVGGTRRVARWLNHSLNACLERRAFLRARRIVTPSAGLAKEIALTYPAVKERLITISNPIDLKAFSPPVEVERVEFRKSLGICPGEVVFVFVALGDFARKGLGLILSAFAEMADTWRSEASILVVGGTAAEVKVFRELAESNGIEDRVRFVGFQSEIRPYLWASDMFVFPSAYETFGLAIFQAAAAGLPVAITAGLHGSDDFVVDGVNGWTVERSSLGVRKVLENAIKSPSSLKVMGRAAQNAAQHYSVESFVSRWKLVYSEVLAE